VERGVPAARQPQLTDRPRHEVVLVNAISDRAVDAIDEYTRLLAGALSGAGVATAQLTRSDAGWQLREGAADAASAVGARDALRAMCAAERVAIQYNPFSWGRRGFAPGLARLVSRLRNAATDVRVALMVHERYVGFEGLRAVPMSVWQRAQLRLLAARSDVLLVSTEAWAGPREHPGGAAVFLPVGSNIPDRRACRASRRAQLGARADTVVLATFGTNHPSRLMPRIEAAANAVHAQGDDVLLLNLGHRAEPLARIDAGVAQLTPGWLAAAEVGAMLAAADVYLAPFKDGVSTRRATLVAALQHGLPIVGTRGPSTGPLLSGAAGLRLVDPADGGAFAAAACALAREPALRGTLGRASRALFDEHFDWAAVARRLLKALA
jgi:glycosyltransferase involved in cell wall biosynthesis